MTRNDRTPEATSDNERTVSTPGENPSVGAEISPLHGSSEKEQGIAIGLRSPPRTFMPVRLRSDGGNPLAGLTNTPPAELLPRTGVSTTGGRRVASKRQSAYVSPLRARAERQGRLEDLVALIKRARVAVLDGGNLIDCVTDGTLWGWRAREALSHVLGEPLANWDRQPGRTQLERLAVAQRTLAELGVVHRGGWRVAR